MPRIGNGDLWWAAKATLEPASVLGDHAVTLRMPSFQAFFQTSSNRVPYRSLIILYDVHTSPDQESAGFTERKYELQVCQP